VWNAAAPHAQSAAINPDGMPDTEPPPELPRTAAAPEQARKCLLSTFKNPNAHLRERKVSTCLNFTKHMSLRCHFLRPDLGRKLHPDLIACIHKSVGIMQQQ
jgi:hypothetical protein